MPLSSGLLNMSMGSLSSKRSIRLGSVELCSAPSSSAGESWSIVAMDCLVGEIRYEGV